MAIRASDLARLQLKQENIRNVSIIAHVDHGKTTLADCLISSNGIISNRLAGAVRYLDDTKEEEDRGITMKANSISLLSRVRDESYIVNLIDSPGHVDFSAEVGSALRVADGSILVVDLVEGVCAQTVAVLRQSWKERVKPILVLNKLDTLIWKMGMDPYTCYEHIRNTLELVNVEAGSILSDEWLDAQDSDTFQESDVCAFDWDQDNEEGFFSPSKGNVVFASALHNWAFTLRDFCELHHANLGIKKRILAKTLWGEFYYSAKKQRIFRKRPSPKAVPMFVQFVLGPIHTIYNAVAPERNMSKLSKVVSSLKLGITKNEVANSKDNNAVIKLIMSRWLPLAKAVLRTIVRKLPNPVEAQAHRINTIFSGTEENFPDAWKALTSCSRDETAPVFAYVSKVFPKRQNSIIKQIAPVKPRVRPRVDATQDAEVSNGGNASDASPKEEAKQSQPTEEKDQFVAMVRVFSGVLKKGMEIDVLSPAYDPSNPTEHRVKATVQDLYMLMGRGLQPIDSVPAGCVAGVSGLSSHILKTASLSNHPRPAVFGEMMTKQPAIMRVALEAVNPQEMAKLRAGMELLNKADSSVKTQITKTGEHIIQASGEVHLMHCVHQLKERFAKIAISVSEPIIRFRETIIAAKARDVKSTVIKANAYAGAAILTVEAFTLPESIRSFLMTQRRVVKQAIKSGPQQQEAIETIKALFDEAGETWQSHFDKLWCFGPNKNGANILVNEIPALCTTPYWLKAFDTDRELPPIPPDAKDSQLVQDLQDVANSVITGFQMACIGGPLMEEPMAGVCLVVKDLEIIGGGADKGPLVGQIITTMKVATKKAFLCHEQRLLELMLDAHVYISDDAYKGATFEVLRRRRAKILVDEMKEGSNHISHVHALLPQAEAFGFAAELFTKTSGSTSAHLAFYGWTILDTDPNFVPTTEDELEEHGEGIGSITPNIAREYIDKVRRRKGLPVKEKLVDGADKQRTHSRKR